MSKLPKAPLVEVIFELRWAISTQEALDKCQYLQGDLYAKVKDNYPYRETVASPLEMLNAPGLLTHRFRTEQDAYPLIQIGPGVMTVNTIDAKYDWDEFYHWVMDAVTNLFEVESVIIPEEVTVSLQYFDYLSFDFERNDFFRFLKENLNVSVEQSFFAPQNLPNNAQLAFAYPTDLGNLGVTYSKGKFKPQESDGIIISTNIRHLSNSNVEQISIWLNDSHDFCSDLFKKMTSGPLYESFKG